MQLPSSPCMRAQRTPSPLLALLFVLLLTVTVLAAVPSSATGGDGGQTNKTQTQSYWTREVMRVQEYTSRKYMARMAARPDVSTLPSGVLVTVVQNGEGGAAPADDDECLIHYTAYFRFNTIWDDTRSFTRFEDGSFIIKGTPVLRRPRDMLPGVAEAMKLMREGDRWFIYIPYTLAYGAEGNAEKEVPPYSSVRYDIELIRCRNPHGRSADDIAKYLQKYLKTSPHQKA